MAGVSLWDPRFVIWTGSSPWVMTASIWTGWMPTVLPGPGPGTAAREMVDFILDFTQYARGSIPGFGVFPQNAEELGTMFPDFMDAMTGIGRRGFVLWAIRATTSPSPPE